MAEPYRVIVVEDDPDVGFYIKTVLTKSGCIVQTFTDPTFAQQAMMLYEPDVVITDIEMPEITGIELIALVRKVRPGTPVVVMTAHVSVDYAIEALRHDADEFLTKPVSSKDLVEVVGRLAEEFRAAKKNAPVPEVVLAIGAHPGDVEIGVGGILINHARGGDSINVLTLSRGGKGGQVTRRQNEAFAAAELLGARLILEDLPDSEIRPDEQLNQILEKVIAEIKPTVVYVHSQNDMHPDHRAVNTAALLASRGVRSVSCYQSDSATVDFRPNRFVNVEKAVEAKLALVAEHASQTEQERLIAPDYLLASVRYWSRFGEGAACEPLEIVRESASAPSPQAAASGQAVGVAQPHRERERVLPQ